MEKERLAEKEVPVLAIDAGYGHDKVWSAEGHLTIPSDVVEVPKTTAYGMAGDPLLFIKYTDPVRQKAYVMGESAISQLEGDTSIAGYMKEKLEREYIQDPRYMVSLLSAIAAAHPNESSLHIKLLMTGLPNDYWADDAKGLIKRLKNNGQPHEFQLMMGGTQREMEIRIDRVMVMPQTFGTLTYFLFNEDGTVNDINQALLQDFCGIIDFGTFTTNMQLTKAMQLVDNLSGSLTKEPMISTSKVYQALYDIILNETKLKKPLMRMPALIQAKSFHYTEGFDIKEFSLEKLAEEKFKEMATNVLERVLRRWQNIDVKTIILTGGGAAIPVVQETFRNMFGARLLIPGDGLPKDEKGFPVISLANALGFYRMGMDLMSKEMELTR